MLGLTLVGCAAEESGAEAGPILSVDESALQGDTFNPWTSQITTWCGDFDCPNGNEVQYVSLWSTTFSEVERIWKAQGALQQDTKWRLKIDFAPRGTLQSLHGYVWASEVVIYDLPVTAPEGDRIESAVFTSIPVYRFSPCHDQGSTCIDQWFTDLAAVEQQAAENGVDPQTLIASRWPRSTGGAWTSQAAISTNQGTVFFQNAPPNH